MVPQQNHVGSLEHQLGTARAELERRIRDGRLDGVEALSEEFPELWSNPEAALELIYTEYVARIENGQSPDRQEWYRRFPERRDRLERLFGLFDLMTAGDTQNGLLETVHPDDEADDSEDGVDQPAGYSLLEEIGRGGSAVVYRARQHSLNRLVAIKILRNSPWLMDQNGRQLRSEAELAARLQHPNIVQVFEVATWKGAPFLAMELVAGTGLHTYLANSQRRGSVSLTSDRAAELVETLARAMNYAHQQGVVHRDLKPANVLIALADGNGWPPATVKIADFGLAVVCDSSQAVTQTLAVAGTPCYMAPEQAEARNADVGPHTDIYALGGILYELLTGRPPFQGATVMETLDLLRHTEPVPPRQIRPQIPRDLETICLKCLQKPVAKRFRTALALAEDLSRFRAGRPILARPVSPIERGTMWARRHPAIAVLSFALLAAMVAGTVIQSNRYRESEIARLNEKKLNAEVQANLTGKLIASARALWNSGQLVAARQLLAECPESLRDADWKTLHQLCHTEIASWPNLEFFGDTLAVSPDGTRLAMHCKGSNRRIQLIDVNHGQPVGWIETPLAMYQMEFTSDGKTLVIVRPPNVIRNPKAATRGSPLETMVGAIGKSSEPTAEVAVWELSNKRPTHRWSIPNPRSMAISGDGRRIAALRGSKLGVWDSVTGKLVTELPATVDTKTRYSLDWDGHGKFLAVRLAKEIQIWNTEASELTTVLPIDAFDMGKWEAVMPMLKDFVDPVYMRPDGRVAIANTATAIASTNDGMPTVRSLTARNTADGRELFQIATNGILPRISFSMDGRMMAIVNNQVVELHDAHTGRHRATLRGHAANIHLVRFSHNGQRLYSMSGDKSLKTWDISHWAN